MNKPAVLFTIGGALALGLWWIASIILGGGTLPGPVVVFQGFFRNCDVHCTNAMVSGLEAIMGLAMASLFASCVVVIAGLLPPSKPIMLPGLTALKCTPAIAFVPILVAICGSGFWCNATTAAAISFFPMVLGGLDGMHSIPNRLTLIADSFGATQWRRFQHITRYYAGLGIARGGKTSTPLAVVGALVGEYVGGGRPIGIGTYIATNRINLQINSLMEGVLAATILGLLCFAMSYAFCEYVKKSLHLEQ